MASQLNHPEQNNLRIRVPPYEPPFLVRDIGQHRWNNGREMLKQLNSQYILFNFMTMWVPILLCIYSVYMLTFSLVVLKIINQMCWFSEDTHNITNKLVTYPGSRYSYGLIVHNYDEKVGCWKYQHWVAYNDDTGRIECICVKNGDYEEPVVMNNEIQEQVLN